MGLTDISTHAPLAGRDEGLTADQRRRELFQPTRPLRGATFKRGVGAKLQLISTHAPLAGRDV